MYLHMIIYEGIQGSYIERFINFIRQNFDGTEHMFVMFSRSHRYDSLDNIYYIDPSSRKDLSWLKSQASDCHKIIVHSLFDTRTIIWLLLHKRFLNKASWILWGGDLYSYWIADSHSLKSRVVETMKKSIIANINSIVALVYEDYLFAKQKYNTKAEYKYAFYPNPVDFEMLSHHIQHAPGSTNRILVGNSASLTNNHAEILKALAKYKFEQDFEIVCPLSYGPSNNVDNVIKLGRELFGKRFIPVLNFMPPEEYAKLLSSIDVAIFGHKRQEGLGNILALLYLGKKVYIRSDISTWSFLSRLGIKVFDSKRVVNNEEEKLFEFSQSIGSKNRLVVEKEFSDEKCVELWREVFRAQ